VDIWMTWCKRKAVCHFCAKDILVRDPMVTGKLWRTKEGLIKWCLRYYWHPQCWLEEGYVYLGKTRYSSGNRGRKPNPIPRDEKIVRVKILRRHAAFTQRIRAAMDEGNVDNVLRLYASMQKLNTEIEQYGGIPDKWLVMKEE